MVKTSFQSLDQLAKYISDNIKELNKGKLTNSDIENLTQNARDLYERLIVIRHKSYEKFGEPNETLDIEQEVIGKSIAIVEEVTEAPIFDFSQKEPSKATIEEGDVMSFDFSETNEEVIPPIIKQETVVETSTIIESITIKKESTSLSESLSINNSSLNDAFKSSGSLGDKLNQSKIDNLKNHIDINKKFSFISDLFSGSNEDYNEAINTLNLCENGDEARAILGDIAIKNSWNVESTTVSTFVDLVERRYLN